MNGVLGFNETLFEMVYQPPNVSDLEDFLESNKTSAFSATSETWIPFSESSKAKELIFFHSHFDRDNEFGGGDLRNIKKMLGAFRDKKSYFVLYTPPNDSVTWYEV